MPSPPVFPRPAPASPRDPHRSDLPDVQPTSRYVFAAITSMSRWRAWQIVGGLSQPTKMPCYAWGTPATACTTGARLAEIQDSTCASCYALRGFFRMPKVQQAYQRRLERFGAAEWVPAMVKLVYWQAAETGEPFFRWFDSGDLRDLEMLQVIVTVARQTPEIQHWLPTREYAIVRAYLRQAYPSANLTIRVSAPLVNGPAPQSFGLPTSGVHTADQTPAGQSCGAYDQKPANCGACRACWDREVGHVSYPLH